jgi:hypothetical protein
MNILAIDLGKFQSQARFFKSEDASHRFERVASSPAVLHDLFLANEIDRLVIQVSHLPARAGAQDDKTAAEMTPEMRAAPA